MIELILKGSKRSNFVCRSKTKVCKKKILAETSVAEMSLAKMSMAEMSWPKRSWPKHPWPKCPSTDISLQSDQIICCSFRQYYVFFL